MKLSQDKYSPEVCYADIGEGETIDETARSKALEWAKEKHCTYIEWYRGWPYNNDCLEVQKVPVTCG
jgi:hypothetical protein